MEEATDLELCMVDWDGDTNTTKHRFSGANADENRQLYARVRGASIHRALRATGWEFQKTQSHKEGKTDYYERQTGTGDMPSGFLRLVLSLLEIIWLIVLLLVILVVVIFAIITR